MKILAIDDNRDNLTALQAVISEFMPGGDLLTAPNGRRGLELALAEDPDVILLDIVMPGMDGYAVCHELKQDPLLQTIPVLFLTALRSDKDSRLKALEAGAEGFLNKPIDRIELTLQIRAMAKIKAAAIMRREANERLSVLVAERTQALLLSQTATLNLIQDLRTENAARKQSESALKQLATAIEQAAEIIMVTDAQGLIQYVNPAFELVTGYTRAESIGMNPRMLKSGQQDEAYYRELWTTIAGGNVWHGRFVNRKKNGALYTEEASISPVRAAAGEIANYVAVKRDITEDLSLQAQLNQAQRMESVGRLAGGVAHDFNNILQVIIGNVQWAVKQAGPDNPILPGLTEIQSAAQRAAELTRQLLAFARQQVVVPRQLDLNATVKSMLKMLRRLIGENIALVCAPGANLWPVRIDPSQIDQILVNLCVNARDAIDGVGRVRIATENVHVDEFHAARHEDFINGDYVLLSVSDTGCGMEKTTADRIFEPFFTTKAVGKGTGLGLATVYGIVRQNQGHIAVYSELGKGATFRLYLPRYLGADKAQDPDAPARTPARGSETVLLVEDDVSILKMSGRMLRELGYTVLAAATPEAGLRMADEYNGEIRLLLTDVIMPGMNGHKLSERIKLARPEIRCLFMSGFTADVIASHGELEAGVHFIQKPFMMADLAAKLREILE